MRQRVTLTDIAEQAGVSTATVSRVLNGKLNVADLTRRQVLADDLTDEVVFFPRVPVGERRRGGHAAGGVGAPP